MIWCVEDDASIRDIEIYTLNSRGFKAVGFFRRRGVFFRALKSETPELVLLDVMLLGESGVSILKKLRADSKTADIPVIMATAKGMEYDKIQSLDLGADDYLVKPFGMMEMVSRVKAVLRRTKKVTADVLTHGGITVNTGEHTVFANGEKVNLTYKEFEILKLFLQNPGTVLTRDRLFAEVWGSDFVGETRTVDMHIRTLRQKLESCGNMIETVRGVGYRLEVSDS